MKKSFKMISFFIAVLMICALATACSNNESGASDGTSAGTQSTAAATEKITEPVTEPVTEPETEPATEPVTEPATEPVTEPVTEPATEAPVYTALPAEYAIGTINAKDGMVNTSNKTRLHNAEYISVAESDGVVIGDGYQLTWLAYDGSKNYLGNGNNYSGLWQPGGSPITVAMILKVYPEAAFFRYAVRKTDGSAISLDDVAASGVTLVSAATPIVTG